DREGRRRRRGRDGDSHRRRLDSLRRHLRIHDRVGDEETGRSRGVPLELFHRRVDAIFAYGGTLDKFIGDAVMAFFGAPLPQDDHADRAVLTGLMLQRMVGEWNVERAKVDLPPVMVRVGINSGLAVVGNVGTEKRVDYTVLGSSVNIASRLESGVAKPGQVVISQNTMDRIMGSFETESLGEFALKGLQQKMPVFAVTATAAGMPASTPHALQATTTR